MDAGPSGSSNGESSNAPNAVDLVGGPFAVIESDPLVFTRLLHTLDVSGLEVQEVYSVEEYAMDHLKPHGLIFCFGEEAEEDEDETPKALPIPEDLWFANQVITDACGTLAVLNIIFNLELPESSLGRGLTEFKEFTQELSPKMKGLAISNSSRLREAHNSLARPADQRAALSTLAISTMDDNAAKKKKRRRFTKENAIDGFHYVAYLPYKGRIYEMDGLRYAPRDVGAAGTQWLDVIRPVLTNRIARASAGDIRFNLLAITAGRYEAPSDALELAKRERIQLERRMGEGWQNKVSAALLQVVQADTLLSSPPGRTFATDFGSQSLEMQCRVLDMKASLLPDAWEQCVRSAMHARDALEEEKERAAQARTEHIKRTWDYEPFIRTYIQCLHNEGILDEVLASAQSKADTSAQAKKTPTRGRGRGRGRGKAK